MQCCGKCDNSYNNSYDDALCKLLDSTTIIDYGGICDFFSHNVDISDSIRDIDEAIIEEEIIATEETVLGSCATCKHSFWDDDDRYMPKCAIDNSRIEMPAEEHRCLAWEE